MATNVIMPQMGESIAEGTVTRWMKKVGERVERDEPLFEISTDKVDAEIPSPAAGVLAKILVKENETVAVNTVVAVINGEGAAVEAPAPSEEAKKPAPQAKSPAPPAEPPRRPVPAPAPTPSAAGPAREPGEKVRSSPLVRRIAREHNVDLTEVAGTGSGGRVSKKDILAYLERPRATGSAPTPAPTAPEASQRGVPPAPAAKRMVFTGPTNVVPMTPMRKQIAEHMVMSRRTSAHVQTVFEVEMTRVAEMRAQHAAEFEKRNGLKLTYTPFFVRAAVEAIKEFPIINSSVDGTNIVYKRDINVGVAVALESGLIVPVIKNADEKNFLGIARAVQDLAERARSKRLSVDDVEKGTFTITNPGIFGGLFGTPIIHQPQVAILGVGAIEKRPVVRQDAIAIRTMVYLMLSFDHRIIDGAVADQFMARVKSILENWDEPVV
ncbi:MAG TPA: 2-oxoglutarate dehydrogenase, E2 component, dihydrolipoamide succinyltransferase [Terriglobia bacterium]|nr:2-oxoglutarate dehydrogenase, E2 component, dihydrolipoamide succinyltransferase [Terriglobia bacterium]